MEFDFASDPPDRVGRPFPPASDLIVAEWPAAGVRLIHGDANATFRDGENAILQRLAIDPNKTACVTDPPYDFETSGGGRLRKSRDYIDEIENAGITDGFDPQLLRPTLFGAVAVFCHDNQGPDLWSLLRRRYWRAVLLAWRKTNPIPACNGNYVPELEIYFHAWLDALKPVGTVKELLRVWSGPVGKSDFDHPTVKPLELMRKIVRNVGAPLIVDPFMGSGTTGVAAVLENRQFIGVEINPKYFEIAKKRIGAAIAQKRPADTLADASQVKTNETEPAAGQLAGGNEDQSNDAATIAPAIRDGEAR